jgi:hypothetical protein
MTAASSREIQPSVEGTENGNYRDLQGFHHEDHMIELTAEIDGGTNRGTVRYFTESQ